MTISKILLKLHDCYCIQLYHQLSLNVTNHVPNPYWYRNGIQCPMCCVASFSLFESSQTLFWASFGLIDLDNFELTGIQSYTRFWGLLMFGSYCVINVVVLLNLLIAMMNHSYQIISVSTLGYLHRQCYNNTGNFTQSLVPNFYFSDFF